MDRKKTAVYDKDTPKERHCALAISPDKEALLRVTAGRTHHEERDANVAIWNQWHLEVDRIDEVVSSRKDTGEPYRPVNDFLRGCEFFHPFQLIFQQIKDLDIPTEIKEEALNDKETLQFVGKPDELVNFLCATYMKTL